MVRPNVNFHLYQQKTCSHTFWQENTPKQNASDGQSLSWQRRQFSEAQIQEQLLAEESSAQGFRDKERH